MCLPLPDLPECWQVFSERARVRIDLREKWSARRDRGGDTNLDGYASSVYFEAQSAKEKNGKEEKEEAEEEEARVPLASIPS